MSQILCEVTSLSLTAHSETETFRLGKLWSLNIRTLCPALIAVLFVYGIVDLFR